jgi:hypothetical protein
MRFIEDFRSLTSTGLKGSKILGGDLFGRTLLELRSVRSRLSGDCWNENYSIV